MTGSEDKVAPAGPGSPDDETAVRAFLVGDVFEVRRVERWAREIVHFRWPSLAAEDGEDIVQDTVTGAWRAVARPGFRVRTSLRALVRRIATARCIDRVRRRRHHVEMDDSLPDGRPAHDEAYAGLDEGARLRSALFDLDERCRKLLQAHFLDERPYADIAAEWQRTEATLRVHVFHCLKSLRVLWRRRTA